MIELAYPWLLLALPLPWLTRALLPPFANRPDALRVPFFAAIAEHVAQHDGLRVGRLQRHWVDPTALALIWLLLVVALTEPRRVEPPLERDVPARDLMLAVDLSGSMATEDYADQDGVKRSRLQAVQKVVGDFITRRKGDRVAIVVFGSQPFLLVPFTNDLATAKQLLQSMVPAVAGPRTALGDAIGLAVHAFDNSSADKRVLILLSDGNDTASTMPPDKAAAIAAERHLIIHSVAIGDPNATGEDRVDLETLRAIARATGGSSFQADDIGRLDAVYHDLDQIEPEMKHQYTLHPRTPLHHWPLAGAVLVAVIFGISRIAADRRAAKREEP